MYVIQRHDGKFVTYAGQANSYTTKLQNARMFERREAAERETCRENERVVDVRDILRRA